MSDFSIATKYQQPFSDFEEWDHFTPEPHVFEGVEEYEIDIEISGLDLKSVEIEVIGDHLIVSGQKFQEYLSETYWIEFKKTIIAPSNISGDNISYAYKHGVLRLVIPKTS